MLTGNKGEWSEPYTLLKLIAEGEIHLGDSQFNKVQNVVFPILKVLKEEKTRNIDFSYNGNLVIVKSGQQIINVPISDFIQNSKKCLSSIQANHKTKGAFGIPSIEKFLNQLFIGTLKEKSTKKNDITIQIQDPNTLLSPTLGFSVKSQLGSPSTLFNASEKTRLVYSIKGNVVPKNVIQTFNTTKKFSDRMDILKNNGSYLHFEEVEDSVFKTNLQTTDTSFDKVISELLILYYSNKVTSDNHIPKFFDKISKKNPLKLDLKTNPNLYNLMIKKFLTDYALGMVASKVWNRNYQANGGYIVVRSDGELVCYNFYFTKLFEEFLFNNTKLDTPSRTRHQYGDIYEENGIQKLKLNLQIRFLV